MLRSLANFVEASIDEDSVQLNGILTTSVFALLLSTCPLLSECESHNIVGDLIIGDFFGSILLTIDSGLPLVGDFQVRP